MGAPFAATPATSQFSISMLCVVLRSAAQLHICLLLICALVSGAVRLPPHNAQPIYDGDVIIFGAVDSDIRCPVSCLDALPQHLWAPVYIRYRLVDPSCSQVRSPSSAQPGQQPHSSPWQRVSDEMVQVPPWNSGLSLVVVWCLACCASYAYAMHNRTF